MPRPAFPVRSMFAGFEQTGFASGQPGILNAAALSHRLIEGPPGGSVLTPATTSGQPPMVLVFEGSNPEKLGVKNWLDCPTASRPSASRRPQPAIRRSYGSETSGRGQMETGKWH